MNIALQDNHGDGYGIFPTMGTAEAEAHRLKLTGPRFLDTGEPANFGWAPEDLGYPSEAQPSPFPVSPRRLLLNAYGLLGDGGGGEWLDNEQYTRGIVELLRDTIGLPDDIDWDGDDLLCFVLGMVHAAHLLDGDR